MPEVNNKTPTVNNLFKLSSNYSNNEINRAILQKTQRDSTTTTAKQFFGRIWRNKIQGTKRKYSDSSYNNGNLRKILLDKNKFERNIKVLNSNLKPQYNSTYLDPSLNISINKNKEQKFIDRLLLQYNSINQTSKKQFAKFIRHYIKLLKLKKDFCSIQSIKGYYKNKKTTIFIDNDTVILSKELLEFFIGLINETIERLHKILEDFEHLKDTFTDESMTFYKEILEISNNEFNKYYLMILFIDGKLPTEHVEL